MWTMGEVPVLNRPHHCEGGVTVSIVYKVNILSELKQAGYNTTRLRRDRLLSEATIQTLRGGGLVSWANINRICAMLDCQPGDLLMYERDHTPGGNECEGGTTL